MNIPSKGAVDPECRNTHINGSIQILNHRHIIDCPTCLAYLQKVQKGEVEIVQTVGSITNSGVISEDLYSYLRIPEKAKHYSFNLENILLRLKYPIESGVNNYVMESVHAIEEELKDIYRYAINGKAYPNRIIFNLGMNYDSNDWYFVYPTMIRAYGTGLKVTPYITDFGLHDLYLKAQTERPEPLHKWGSDFRDYIDADMCFISIDGTNLDTLRILAEERYRKGKGTIVFAHRLGSDLNFLTDRFGYVDNVSDNSFRWVGIKTYSRKNKADNNGGYNNSYSNNNSYGGNRQKSYNPQMTGNDIVNMMNSEVGVGSE